MSKSELQQDANRLEDKQRSVAEVSEILGITNRGALRKLFLKCMEEKIMSVRPIGEANLQELTATIMAPYQNMLFRTDPQSIAEMIGVGNFCGGVRMIVYNALLDYQSTGAHDPSAMYDFFEEYSPRIPLFSEFYRLFDDETEFPPAFVESVALLFMRYIVGEHDCEKHADAKSRFIQGGSKLSDYLQEKFHVMDKLQDSIKSMSLAFTIFEKVPGSNLDMNALQALDDMCGNLLARIPKSLLYEEEVWEQQLENLERARNEAPSQSCKLLARYALVVNISNIMAGYTPWDYDDLEKLTLTLHAASTAGGDFGQ